MVESDDKSIIRLLIVIGGIVGVIEGIIGIVGGSWGLTHTWGGAWSVVGGILSIIISVLVLGAVGVVSIKRISDEWIILLIMGILLIIFGATIGGILIIIGALLKALWK